MTTPTYAQSLGTLASFVFMLVVAFYPSALCAQAEVRQIGMGELRPLVEGGRVAIVDTNGTVSYERRGHLPGAKDYAQERGRLARVLPNDRKALVVIYANDARDDSWRAAADEALAAGFTNVRWFAGGLVEWMRAGAPLEKGGRGEE